MLGHLGWQSISLRERDIVYGQPRVRGLPSFLFTWALQDQSVWDIIDLWQRKGSQQDPYTSFSCWHRAVCVEPWPTLLLGVRATAKEGLSGCGWVWQTEGNDQSWEDSTEETRCQAEQAHGKPGVLRKRTWIPMREDPGAETKKWYPWESTSQTLTGEVWLWAGGWGPGLILSTWWRLEPSERRAFGHAWGRYCLY